MPVGKRRSERAPGQGSLSSGEHCLWQYPGQELVCGTLHKSNLLVVNATSRIHTHSSYQQKIRLCSRAVFMRSQGCLLWEGTHWDEAAIVKGSLIL